MLTFWNGSTFYSVINIYSKLIGEEVPIIMKKKILAFILIFTLVISFSACSKGNIVSPGIDVPQGGPPPAENKDQQAKSELLKMLPDKVGAEWVYNGFAEYGHKMKIDSISNALADEKAHFLISGKVDDMSDGEAKGDFDINLEYVVSKDGIREIIKKGEKMPHKISEFDVLRYPLTKGNTWTQQVSINGSSTELKAEIIEIGKSSDNSKTIKVQYTAKVAGMPNDTYKEVRTFEEGKGLVSFENTFDKDIDFSYSLYKFTE